MRNLKKLVVILFSFFAGNAFLSAQSADVITEILNSDSASLGQLCYLSAVQQNLVDESADYDAAIKALYDNNQISEIDSADRPVNYSEISYVFSKIWNINGSLMFRIFKTSERYAFKQFKNDDVFASSIDPQKKASGSDLLNVLSNCISIYGDFDISAVDMDN